MKSKLLFHSFSLVKRQTPATLGFWNYWFKLQVFKYKEQQVLNTCHNIVRFTNGPQVQVTSCGSHSLEIWLLKLLVQITIAPLAERNTTVHKGIYQYTSININTQWYISCFKYEVKTTVSLHLHWWKDKLQQLQAFSLATCTSILEAVEHLNTNQLQTKWKQINTFHNLCIWTAQC